MELQSEVELEEHIVSDMHDKAMLLPSSLNQFPHYSGQTRGRGRGKRGKEPFDPKRGKVYKGRPNAMSTDSMKAQRGRLVSLWDVL